MATKIYDRVSNGVKLHPRKARWVFQRTGDELEPEKVTLVSGSSGGRPLDESFQSFEKDIIRQSTPWCLYTMGTHVSFIFRGYNPYVGGVKPSFFMVLWPIEWCWGQPPKIVTTRNLCFLVGIELNLRVPLLLGRGTSQYIHSCIF